MFRRAIAIIVLIFASIYLFSCAGDYTSVPQSSTTQPQIYSDLIKELENIYETEGMYELVCSLVDMSGYMTMVTELDMQEKTNKKENVEKEETSE